MRTFKECLYMLSPQFHIINIPAGILTEQLLDMVSILINSPLQNLNSYGHNYQINPKSNQNWKSKINKTRRYPSLNIKSFSIT